MAERKMIVPASEADAAAALALAVRVAPNGLVQQYMGEIYNYMVKAHEPWSAIVVNFAGMIIDGLRHGNWPVPPQEG